MDTKTETATASALAQKREEAQVALAIQWHVFATFDVDYKRMMPDDKDDYVKWEKYIAEGKDPYEAHKQVLAQQRQAAKTGQK